MANTGLYDCCGTVDGRSRGCVRNRVVAYAHANEIRLVEPGQDGNVALAMGYRYNVLPCSEDVLLRDCQFTPAIDFLGVPTNTYVAVSRPDKPEALDSLSFSVPRRSTPCRFPLCFLKNACFYHPPTPWEHGST